MKKKFEGVNQYQLKDIKVGMTATIERSLSREDIHRFSLLTGDYHPLHTAPEYARQHGFNDIIAHGLLISSFSSTLIGMKLPGENTVIISQTFKYRHPAYPGDGLAITGVVTKVEERFSRVEIKVKIVNDIGKTVASGLYLIKIRA